jgi:3-methyladenine DNA glycosylase AlkD
MVTARPHRRPAGAPSRAIPSLVAPTVLNRLHETYKANRNPAQAVSMVAYMRNQFPFVGLTQADRQRLNRVVLDGTPTPTEADLAEVARRCWDLPEREYQYFAVGYLRRWVPRVPASPEFVAVAEQLIVTKSWWDTVDELAQHVVGWLVLHHPQLSAVMDEWIASDDLWLARTAIIHQERFKAETDAERLFRYCLHRASDRDFFIRKAIGWALREYSKTDADAVRRFVADHASELSPLSQREALKWLARRQLS